LVSILGLGLSLLVLVLQLLSLYVLSFVLVRLRQLLRIKTAILWALTHRGFQGRLLPSIVAAESQRLKATMAL
jgi:hypothetical protein